MESFAQQPKKPRPKRQVLVSVKQKVWRIREREEDCCGQKIAYFLEKEHGITLSVPKIYEILQEKYVLRSKWQKYQKRGDVPSATAPRQVTQRDTVDFGKVFAFTAVDIFSLIQTVHKCVNPTAAASSGEFVKCVGDFCYRHRVARPYKKNEQSYIESFNRTVRKECLGWRKYKGNERDAMQTRRGTPFWNGIIIIVRTGASSRCARRLLAK